MRDASLNSQLPISNCQRIWRIRRSPQLGVGSWVLGVVMSLVLPASVVAQINMPDPSIIHGKALPAPELAVGTVTVRVVREAIGNNVTGQDVRVTVGGNARTAR